MCLLAGRRQALACQPLATHACGRDTRLQSLSSSLCVLVDGPAYFAQVHIYLPDAQHPAHGLVRVIVKDSRDTFTGAQSRTWLDSGERPSRSRHRAPWPFCRMLGLPSSIQCTTAASGMPASCCKQRLCRFCLHAEQLGARRLEDAQHVEGEGRARAGRPACRRRRGVQRRAQQHAAHQLCQQLAHDHRHHAVQLQGARRCLLCTCTLRSHASPAPSSSICLKHSWSALCRAREALTVLPTWRLLQLKIGPNRTSNDLYPTHNVNMAS